MTTMTTTRKPGDRSAEHAPLAIAVAIAGGTMAYADPVRFENDGSFGWTDNRFLDITKPVGKQTGFDAGEASFEYIRFYSYCCYPKEEVLFRGSTPDAELPGTRYVTIVKQLGAIVPHDFGDDWDRSYAPGYYYMSGAGFYTQFDDRKPFGVPGDVGYIAARFNLDGQTHYGWMSLTLTHFSGPVPNWVFDLVAWGYETEPGRRIAAGAVPAPSAALALLAFGAAAGATRARREPRTRRS